MEDLMAQRRLGNSNIMVSPIGLGCLGMSYALGDYGRSVADNAQSTRVIHRALDLGVNFFDTSDAYGPFTNEDLVGAALRGHRDEVVVATKGGTVVTDPATVSLHRDGRPLHLQQAIDSSLSRLKMDHVDLYQLHRIDETVPVEDSWSAMAEFVQQGKTRSIGMCEVTVDELAKAHRIHPVASVQSELSVWTRGPLDDVLPWCVANDVAFIAYSPLGVGYLTGRLSTNFTSHDVRSKQERFTTEAMAANTAILDGLRAVGDRKGGATSGQVALAWLLSLHGLVVPIPGTSKTSHLEENVAAADLQLTAGDVADLDGLPAPTGGRWIATR
jgi:aryl-alcohol dehydrogenase-like predicted oxidoreductase